MDGDLYILEIEGYDGDDTGIETWRASATKCGDCGHGLVRHKSGGGCAARGCRCGWFLPVEQAVLFAVIEIKNGRAGIIDSGYRSRAEALDAWPEAKRKR